MPTVLQLRRGTAAQNNAFTGAAGEITVDTSAGTLRVHDNSTAGGNVLVGVISTQTLHNKTIPVIAGTTVVTGNLVANTTTTSTSTTTGALVVGGGVGISGNIYLSGNIVGSSSGAWTVPAGTNAQRPGAASNGMMRYNSDITSFEGYYAGAWSSLGGVKSVDGKAYITAEASAGAGDDVIRVYSGSSGTSTQVMWASVSNISILPSTVSTSSTTGALQVTGGIGIGGNVFTAGWIVPTANTTQNLGTTSSWWGTLYGVSTQAKYADLAENYTADTVYAPGTVLIFGGSEEVTTTVVDHDTRVAGIVSTNPAHLMNGGLQGETVIALGLTGRLPCQVQGPVSTGDVLVTSTTPGVARRIDNSKFLPGCVVGKALESIPVDEIKIIEVVVGRF